MTNLESATEIDTESLRRQAAMLLNQAAELARQAREIQRRLGESSAVHVGPDSTLESAGVTGNTAFPLHELSQRELQVFEMMGEGLEMREIATCLHISTKTIETYRARLGKKLNQKSRLRLIRAAVEWNLTQRHSGLRDLSDRS